MSQNTTSPTAERPFDPWDPLNPEIASPAPEPPAYRLLETGEIIKDGDEFLGDASNLWLSAFSTGIAVRSGQTYRRPITGGAGLHEAATCDQSAPASPKLSVLLAAAEKFGAYCFHVTPSGAFCVDDAQIHGEHSDHPCVSLSTLLSTVAALASEPLMKELDEARTSDPALLAAARYSEEKVRNVWQHPAVNDNLIRIVLFFIGAIVGIFLAWGFLALS